MWGSVEHNDLQEFADEYGVELERVMEIYLHVLGELKEKKHNEFVHAVKETINDARKNIQYGETLSWDDFFKIWNYEGYSDPEWFEDVSIDKLKKEFEKQTTDPDQLPLF